MARIMIRPVGFGSTILDGILHIFMRMLAGRAFLETPQRTHPWNKRDLRPLEAALFDRSLCVHTTGDPSATVTVGRWPFGRWRFHAPAFGGWRRYIVVAPTVSTPGGWYVGWLTADLNGVSRIRLKGPVRLLWGPNSADFFCIDSEGSQVPADRVGEGSIGNKGTFSQLPLL